MNLPNKLTMARIFISIIIIAILLFPFDSMGITTTKFFINESDIYFSFEYVYRTA